MSGRDRTDVLAARVRWLDRHRRRMSVIVALVVAPLLILKLADVVGEGWPELHGLVLSVVLGVIVWWVVEVALAWLTAVWETECAGLTRDQRVPRAVVVQR